MPLRTVGIWLTFAAFALAQNGYSRLIALPDGKTVYFSFATTPFQVDSYVARATDDGSIRVENAGVGLVGASDSGNVLLRATFAVRVFYSDCVGPHCPPSINPSCKTRLTLEDTGGVLYSQTDYPSQGQVSRSGTSFWISRLAHSTFAACEGGTARELTPGLHTTASPNTLIWESPGANLIPAGPRSITDSGRALLLDDNRLVWFDATGSHAVPQLADANEATVDRTGDNIVYVERGPHGGPLHWIAQDSDIPLGLSGSWPALSDDGQTLLFLSLDYKLEIYSLTARTLTEVGLRSYSPPAVAGNHAAFAVDDTGRLVRIDLDSLDLLEWLPGAFELSPWTSFPFELNPLGLHVLPPPPALVAGPREIVTLRGAHLDTPGWKVSLFNYTGNSTPMKLHIESPVTAWFQVPSSIDARQQIFLRSELEGQAGRTFDIQVSLADGAFYCLPPVHEGSDRPVTVGDPAHIGEVVHYLLSGLVPIEAVDDQTPNPTDHEIGVVNPPRILEPAAFEVKSLGLAPGLIGYQRLDLGVLAQPSDPNHLFQPSQTGQIAFGCRPPALAK